jgi:enterobacterial common antigen flippase
MNYRYGLLRASVTQAFPTRRCYLRMNQNISKKPVNSDDEQFSTASKDDLQIEDISSNKKDTYGQILKSSAVIGGSSMVNIAIGIVRTKAMALLLGPSGIGLMGLYSSIADLTQSIAGMGINSSGVRQIAEAVGSGDTMRIAKTAQVLQRTSLFLGLLGAVFLFGFSTQLSTLTFGNTQHANGVALLSLAVFLNLVSAGQGALIQGMRRIADLAKMGVLGALFGTLISIPTVYYLHEEGIVLSLVLIATTSLITSWWYRRKIKTPSFPIASSRMMQEQTELLKLGFTFMSSGLMMAGAAYVVRLFIVRDLGFDAAGLYQSAWTLGGLYVGFILQAMGTDFYPRLTAIANDNVECNRVVNEQAHVSLLLAGPGVIATLTFAPLVVALFYSSKFDGAIEILRWLCLGMTLRVVSWPMGFIIVAKGARNFLIFSELAWTIVYLGFAWIGINAFKLPGVGIAFFGSYIFHVAMIYLIVRRLSGFRWSSANLKTSCLYLTVIGLVFCCYYALPPILAIGVGVLATTLSCIYSINVIVNLVSLDRIPRHVVQLLVWLRLLKPLAFMSKRNHNSMPENTFTAVKPILGINYLIGVSIIFTCFYLWINEGYRIDGWADTLGMLKNDLLSFLSGF